MKDVSVIRLVHHRQRVIQSRGSVRAGREWREDFVRLADRVFLDSPLEAAELVTVIQWAPCPCSVTVMAPVTADRALWATSATNAK